MANENEEKTAPSDDPLPKKLPPEYFFLYEAEREEELEDSQMIQQLLGLVRV